MTTLYYRGLRYDRPELTLEMTESDIMAQYRGQTYPVRRPQAMNIPQPTMLCKYRGVAYRTLTNGAIDHAPASEVLAPVAAQVAQDELHRIHNRNLCARLAERIESAKAHGDSKLMQMLERESQDLVCSR